jgi:Flp pilus assembly protein TadB
MFEFFTNYKKRLEISQRHLVLGPLICCIVICAPFALLVLFALPGRLEVRVILVGVMLATSVPLMFWGVNRDRRAPKD